jgi:ubiquinone/menaquinone biosynthesis C-methylase UbiE
MGLGKIESWLFDLQYLLGRTPWDTGMTPPEVVELIEGGGVSPGWALDMGCGTGTNCIYLAHHGWEAVGVDLSAVAIHRARQKARQGRVHCQFYRADVSDLAFLKGLFDLVLGIGCLHSVPVEERERYAAGVARLVQSGGLYMLYAFASPSRYVPRGVPLGEVRRLFASIFALERQEGGDDPTGPQSAWYWLRRIGSGLVNSSTEA